MLLIFVFALCYVTLTQALTANIGPDNLDPIFHQEHAQSPNGHNKYGYESNEARAHEVHNSDSTSKGFYSYLDNQGKMQHLGYNDLSVLPSYTPEVEAARKAHLDAYLETRSRDLAQHAAIKKPEVNKEMPFTINIPIIHESKPVNNHFSGHSSIFGDEGINLFSGQPLQLSHRDNYNFHPSVQGSFPTTTRPIQDYKSKNIENNFFVLPTPTVHHYEKIWPLPQLRFKDLEVRVNGQDWYDPRPRYPHTNSVVSSLQTPQNTFNAQQKIFPLNFNNIPILNQFIQNVGPGSTGYISKPNVPSLQPPVTTEKPQNIFNFPQMIFHSLDFPDPFGNQMSKSFHPTNVEADSRINYFEHTKTSGLTAHEADLMNYRQKLLENDNMPNAKNTTKYSLHSDVRIMPKNNVVNFESPKIEVVQKNVALAAKKVFDLLKGKHN